MPRQETVNQPLPSRARIVGTLTKKLPLYCECGMTRATIVIRQYMVHLSGRDAAATQSLQIGARVEIVGTVRRAGQRSLLHEIDGELMEYAGCPLVWCAPSSAASSCPALPLF